MSDIQRVITVRKYFNLNQTEFAIRVGTVQSKVCMIEQGKQALNLEMFRLIIAELKVYPQWLLGQIGNDDKVMFDLDFVPKEQLEQKQLELDNELKEKYALMQELLKYKTQKIEELQNTNI